MILEPMMLAVLTLCGSFVLLALGRRSVLDHAALALPVGVAMLAVVSLLLVVGPLGYAAGMALVLTVAACAAVLAVAVRQGTCGRLSRTCRPALVWAMATTLGSGAALALRGVRVTSDSYEYLQTAGVLEATGGLSEPAYLFVTRQLLTGAVHNLGSLYGRPHVASLAPMFAVSGLAALYWFYRRLAGRDRRPSVPDRVVLVLLLVAVLTANRTVFHAFYVNAHLMVGVYTLLAAGTIWLVALRRLPPSTLVLACLSIVPIVLARPESPTFLPLVLLPAMLLSDIDRPWRSALVWTFAVTVVVWWGVGLGRLDDWSLSSPTTASVAAAVVVTVLFEATRKPAVAAWLRRRGVLAAHVAIWAALALALARDPDRILSRSIPATWTNLIGGEGLWGASIVGLAVLVAVGARVRRLPAAQVLLLPLTAFLPLAMLLAYLRDGAYRVGPGDSLNRMWVHVLLLAAAHVLASFTGPSPPERPALTEEIPASRPVQAPR